MLLDQIGAILEMFTWYDWCIVIYGMFLLGLHVLGLIATQPYNSKFMIFLAKNHEEYRTFLHQLTELLPVMALIGTVYGLLITFSSLDLSEADGMQTVVKKFGIAMTATFVGLGFSLLNLFANAVLWAIWQSEKRV